MCPWPSKVSGIYSSELVCGMGSTLSTSVIACVCVCVCVYVCVLCQMHNTSVRFSYPPLIYSCEGSESLGNLKIYLSYHHQAT